MKNLLKLSALAAVLVASATYASAADIQLGSFCSSCAVPSGDVNTGLNWIGFIAEAPNVSATGTYTETTMYNLGSTFTPEGGVTYNVSPGADWAPALANSSWVSAYSTGGPGGGANPPQGFYLYQTTFSGTGAYTGTLNLWADDTAAVFLNGVPLLGFGTLGGDGHCASTAPTCLNPLATVTFSALLTGTNTLSILAIQAGDLKTGDPSGIDFNATLTPTTVPEPSTLLMLGTGLIGSAGAMFRRMRR